MTTPQPQPMKRYEPGMKYISRVGNVPVMLESPTGPYIRIDDPALVAAREAMEKHLAALDRERLFNKRNDRTAKELEGIIADLDVSEEELRLALAGLKGPA